MNTTPVVPASASRCAPIFPRHLGTPFVFAAFVMVSPAAAQCRAEDDSSAYMIADLKRLSNDAQEVFQRRDLKIPVVDTAGITLVTQTEICKKVLNAFLTTLPADYPIPLPTSVYVVAVGNVYAAMHPSEKVFVYAVIDSKFRVLSKYGQ